jgi:hypothetical protein
VQVVKQTLLLLGKERVGTEAGIERTSLPHQRHRIRVARNTLSDARAPLAGLLSPLGGIRARQAYTALTHAIVEAARADHSGSQLE